MGKRVDSKQFLYNCAGTVMGQLKLETNTFDPQLFTCASMVRNYIPGAWRGDILLYVQNQSDEYIGRLACASRRNEAVSLATDALVDAIAECVWADLQKAKVQAEAVPKYAHLKCKFCGWTVRKYWREGSRAFSGFTALASHIESKHWDQLEKIYAHMGEPEVESE